MTTPPHAPLHQQPLPLGEPPTAPASEPAGARLPPAGPSKAARRHVLGADAATRLGNYCALKHVLFGDSAIDLPRLWFGETQAVDAFIRLCGFDTDNPLELARLGELHHEATVYLSEVHRYRLPLEIEQAKSVTDLFLAASTPHASRVQRFACMTLKAMHILHHISGRELLFNTPISEAQLFESLGARVFALIDAMRGHGVGVAEFAAGKKSRISLATKLLAKRTNLATHIFDRLRFRIVLESRDDVVMALTYLLRHLVPFNYVLPEQSENTVLGPQDMVRAFELSDELARSLWHNEGRAMRQRGQHNEFSGLEYRTINFVADIPLRIDDVAPQARPAIAFVQTEIQLLDAATARRNERGESAHSLYKKRQRARVRARLESQDWARDPALESLWSKRARTRRQS